MAITDKADIKIGGKRAQAGSAKDLAVPARGRRARGRRGRPKPEEIDARIDLAKKVHAGRVTQIDNILDIYHRIYKNVKKDVKDTGVPIIKTPRGEAIIDAVYALTTVGADLETQVLPLKVGEKEQELCSELERALEGIQFEIQSLKGAYPFHEGLHEFWVKGMGAWRTYFDPGVSGCPLFVESLDPASTYPIEDDKLIWVVHERQRYAGEFMRMLKRTKGSRDGRKLAWGTPKMGEYDDDEKWPVVRYCDAEWEALRVRDKYVYIRPNLMDFIPYSFAKCRHAPDADPQWQAQSYLAPMLGLLLLETEILSKFGTSLSLFFYPPVIAQEPSGRAVILSAAPGEIDNVSPEAKISVLQRTANIPEAQNLLAQVQALMNIIGLPAVIHGEPPGQVQAGYPMALLLNAVKTKLNREAEQIEWGLGKTQEHLLRHIEKFGGLNGGIPIYVGLDGSKRGRKALLTVKDKDVQGHYRVKVTISPKMPQDWMQYATIGAKLRQENKFGEPILSDDTIRELIFEIKEPEEEKERIFEQFMQRSDEVRAYQMEKWLEDWRKRERIKTPEQLAEAARMLIPPARRRQMMGPVMEQGMGVPPQVMPPAMSGQPPQAPVMPGQEGPGALLRQMMPPRGY